MGCKRGEALECELLWNINRQSNGLVFEMAEKALVHCLPFQMLDLSNKDTNTHLIGPTAVLRSQEIPQTVSRHLINEIRSTVTYLLDSNYALPSNDNLAVLNCQMNT